MKRIFSLFAFCFILTAQANAQQVPATYGARLQEVLDSVCGAYNIKGVSAAVIAPGIGTWKGTWGISHDGQPITDDMLLGIGSNTKTYTAALILKMQEEGLMNIEDTIGTWIQNQPNINGAITIRQMLNHTSGIASYTEHPHFFDSMNEDLVRVWQPQELLQFIGNPDFQPGQGFHYSNSNYLLAGMIISQVAGQPYEAVLRSKILQPQGLTNTFYYPQETITGTMPHAWFLAGGGMIDLTENGISLNAIFSAASSAGAIVSTAEDNAKFWQLLISGQMINTTSLSLMRQFDVSLGNGARYGLGIMRYTNFNGHVVYEHGGTNLGFINENLADSATGVTISVLSNQDSIDNNKLLNGIVKALHKVTINPPTAIEDVSVLAGWNIWPNPAKNVLHLSAKERAGYIIYDVTGKAIQHGLIMAGHNQLSIAALNPGLYVIRIGGTVRTLVVQ